jgi:hypothetical protein
MKVLQALNSLLDPTQMAYPKQEAEFLWQGFLIQGRRFINVRR